MKKGMGQPGQRLLTAAEKVLSVGKGRKVKLSCSDCNAPTLFRNIQRRSLVGRERGTLQTRYAPSLNLFSS